GGGGGGGGGARGGGAAGGRAPPRCPWPRARGGGPPLAPGRERSPVPRVLPGCPLPRYQRRARRSPALAPEQLLRSRRTPPRMLAFPASSPFHFPVPLPVR